MRGFLLFLLLPFCALAAAAELRLSGNESKVPLAEYLESYEDISAAMDIEAISKTGSFTPVPPKLLHPGYTQSAIWLRLNITNAAATPLTRWIAVQPARLQEVGLLFQQQGRWQRIDAGTNQPFAQHPIPATGAVFPLQLAASESATVYLRVASSTAIAIDPTLWEPLAFRATDNNIRLLDGLLLGGMALAALYALLMFVTLKDRAFLLLALASIAYCIYEISFRGYGLMYLWPGATNWATRSIGVFATLSTGGLLLFVRELLATRSRMPRWDRLLLALLLAACLASPA